MHKSFITALSALFLFSAPAAFAADNNCYKAYGDTPDKAFRAAAELLKQVDAELGPGWMKDNMQVRLLPDKIKGQFVALLYSAVHDTEACDFDRDKKEKMAEQPRPECNKTQCTI